MRKLTPLEKVIDAIAAAARSEREFGVPGRVRFKFVRETPRAIILERRNGKTATIGKAKLAAALEGVRADHRLYIGGPGALREVGITHINSPIYALLRLLPLNRLID